MLNIKTCRRTFICLTALICLTTLGLVKGMDVSYAIAAVAVGLAGANSAENAFKKPGQPGV